MKSVEARVYAYRFAVDFMLIYPFYAVMFADNGLSTAQISVLFFAWSATTIFEIPSGVLADKLDRRYVLGCGQVLTAAGFATWLVFDSFWGFLVGFVLWGISGTLSSGTFEALLFDELKSRNQEHRYLKVNGRAEGLALIAILLSTLVAAATPDGKYTIPLVASVVLSLIAGLVALSLPKAPPNEEVADTQFFSVLKGGFLAAFRTPALLRAIVPAAVALSIFGTFDEYFPLYLNAIELDNTAIALACAAVGATASVSAFLAHRAEHFSIRSVSVTLAASGVLLVIAALLQSNLGVVLIGAFFFLTKAAEVISAARVQHAIDAPMRATITSVSAFSGETLAVGFYVIFALAPHNNVFTGFLVSGAVLAVVSFGVATLGNKGTADQPPSR